jgi:hypothetical protein
VRPEVQFPLIVEANNDYMRLIRDFRFDMEKLTRGDIEEDDQKKRAPKS